MAATRFTTAQSLPFTLKVVDGRGKTVKIDGTPVAAVSDPTIATVGALTDNGDGTWSGSLVAAAPSLPDTTQQLTVTADVDLSAQVQDVIGTLEFAVDLDPRDAQRIVQITAGTPVDQA